MTALPYYVDPIKPKAQRLRASPCRPVYFPKTSVQLPPWAADATINITESATMSTTQVVDPEWLYGKQTLADMERAHILHTLARNDGHRKRTAKALDMGERTLGLKLKEYGVNE